MNGGWKGNIHFEGGKAGSGIWKQFRDECFKSLQDGVSVVSILLHRLFRGSKETMMLVVAGRVRLRPVQTQFMLTIKKASTSPILQAKQLKYRARPQMTSTIHIN